MGFSQAVLDKLNQPLEPADVDFRQGGGGNELSYMRGVTVDRKLIDIFGAGNVSTQVLQHPVEIRPGLMQAVVRVSIYDDEGNQVVSLTDVGYGTHTVTDTTKIKTEKDQQTGKMIPVRDAEGNYVRVVNMASVQEIEKAGKEAVTDARKRCLTSLGPQFGLDLYDKFHPIHKEAKAAKKGEPSSSSSSTRRSSSTNTSAPRSSSSSSGGGRAPITPDMYPPSNDGKGGWQCDLCGKPIVDSKNGQWKAGELALFSARSNDGQIRCFNCKDK